MRPEDAQRQAFVDIPFTKRGKSSKGLEIVGYASTWVLDRDNERVDPHAFDDTLETYLSKNPIVLYQHDHEKPFGNVAEAGTDEHGLQIEALLPPPASGEEGWAVTAFNKVDAGILKTLSIGGMFQRRLEVDPQHPEVADVVIEKVDLFEISVVSIPSNPDSVFEAASKAFRAEATTSVMPVRGKALDQVEQLLGIKDLTDPDLVTMNEGDRRERYDALIKALPDSTLCYDDYREALQLFEDGHVLGSLAAVEEVIAKLYVAPASKAGRVLSKANESKLQSAYDTIGEVLDQVKEGETVEETVDENSADADEKWDGSPGRYTDSEYARACVLDRAKCGAQWRDRPTKERYSLPIATPGNGTASPDRGGVHAAASRFGSTKACPEAKKSAARALVRAYRKFDEEPPDNIRDAAKDTETEGAAA